MKNAAVVLILTVLMFSCAKKKDADVLKKVDERGRSALHLSILEGDDRFEKLVSDGADINLKDKIGRASCRVRV